MIDFICTRCGHCCSNTQSVQADSHRYGLYLAPDEAERFPQASVAPLFKAGDTVTAYQLRDQRCPHLGESNDCAIYTQRPLACRAFPVIERGVIQGDCTFVGEHPGELISEASLIAEQAASDAQHAQITARPSAKFPLDLGRWIPA